MNRSCTDMPICDYLDKLVQGLRRNLTRALRDWDVEAVHKARVGARRLRAAVELLAPVISASEGKRFDKTLRKLRRRLAVHRDIDVMLGHLERLGHEGEDGPEVEWLRERLEAERARRRVKTAGKVDQPAVLEKLGGWSSLREDISKASDRVETLLAEAVHLQLDAFAEQAAKLREQGALRGDAHELRLSGKRLRYTLEMAGAQGLPVPGEVVETFKRMQDALGLWHDLVVLSETAMRQSVEQMLAHRDAGLARRVLGLAERMLEQAEAALGQFAQLWTEAGPGVSETVRRAAPLTRRGG